MRELHVSFPAPCGEQWESMAPTGCSRHCATCDKTIYDLETHGFEEIEALLDCDDELCVRARIGADGTVVQKSSGRSATGRLVLAAASAGLLATAAPALAEGRGKIVGKIETSYWQPAIFATDAAGKSYRAGVRRDGRFWIKNLPPGEYVVTATSCGTEAWTVGKITVADGESIMPVANEPPEDVCIIVGVMQIEQRQG